MSIDDIVKRMKEIREIDGPDMLNGQSSPEFADLLIALAEEVKKLKTEG